VLSSGQSTMDTICRHHACSVATITTVNEPTPRPVDRQDAYRSRTYMALTDHPRLGHRPGLG
jgi:hypothetical protein